MDDFIYLVRSEMIVAAQLLTNNQENLYKNNNIWETNEYIKKKISSIWLDIFKNGKY